jgi:hypothetical protein
MPHYREALHNIKAMLGARAIVDEDKLLAALEGMGIRFETPAPCEKVVGSLPSATAADLRDNQVCLATGTHTHIFGMQQVDEELRAIGFCIARTR